MFSTGKIVFSIIFIAGFVIALIWSYKKDQVVNKIHFKKPYLVLAGLLLFFTLLFVIVKSRKYF